MLYEAYQANADALAPLRVMSAVTASALGRLPDEAGDNWFVRSARAGAELTSRLALTHRRPAFGITATEVGGEQVPVREEAAAVTPFGTLLHFAKDTAAVQPRVLVIAPLSGHFATLLRSTVASMLPDHDVYVTDWHNARDVALHHGRFGLDEYIAHLIDWFELIGPGAHGIAVCQPCVPALAAAALLAEDGSEAQPRSLTLMAGPVDGRINPTEVNIVACAQPIVWFERNVIDTVPLRFRGAMRRVYPGFVQLAAFLSMNRDRHRAAFQGMYDDIVEGNEARATSTMRFYDEYFAVLDLTAEFYLDTVRAIFQEHLLARGELTWRGRPVDPGAITRMGLLTVEGERDDICAVGQTMAALNLCTGLARGQKRHHLQPGVGHFGVFSGRRWETQVLPLVRTMILAND
jgi:poly(3-hydroxybutyrate) depolymerase